MERSLGRLPVGVFDQEPAQREAAESIARRLTSLFFSWGYRQVEPPVFEYYETFRAGGAAFSEERVYRFLDRGGMLLALRPDMTTGIARMMASRLLGIDPALHAPSRLCYAGPVFRCEATGSGRPHTFYQAGIELIGRAGPATDTGAGAGADSAQDAGASADADADADSDAETVALALAAVSVAIPGTPPARVVLGHAGLAWQALGATGGLSAERSALFRAAAANRDLVSLHDLLGPQLAALLAGGPYPWPGLRSVLSALRAAAPQLAQTATGLEDMFAALADHGVRDMVLDLTLLRDLDYYTGMVFEIVVPGLAAPIAGGGRYDELMGRFGTSLPATGFALDVGAAVAAATAGRSAGAALPASRLGVVARADASPASRRSAVALASALRAQGYQIQTDLRPAPVSEALRRARALGAARLWLCEETDGGGYREIRVSSPGAAQCASRASSEGGGGSSSGTQGEANVAAVAQSIH